ncbi:tigger transposable element-derived 6 [Brachionus plicatilis]|uniref:Tigger transposable element-derived 6 n=1 Tax=Brachionus plicatilis TaxID=10195 RepID=A0A3M7RM89_BRAPC|nr:tigger transposable element-derived 6 [Brachionus plicatilis]
MADKLAQKKKKVYDEVDKSVLFWFEQVQKYMSGSEIQQQALKFATMLGHEFKASNGWLCKFKERNGISLKTTIDKDGEKNKKRKMISN